MKTRHTDVVGNKLNDRAGAIPILYLLFATIAILVCGDMAWAQVFPHGSHHTSVGPGTRLRIGDPQGGGFASSVPIVLPQSRSSLPIPFSIDHTGGVRAGSAGVGWDIPLSYVRVHWTISRRKPKLGANAVTEIGEQVTLSIGGTTTLMVPSSKENVLIPRVAKSYLVLERKGLEWEARNGDGITYRFRVARNLPGGASLHDDNLWLMTSVEEQPKTGSADIDRVAFKYHIKTEGCHRGMPEIRIEQIEYTHDTDDNHLYQVDLHYRRFDLTEFFIDGSHPLIHNVSRLERCREGTDSDHQHFAVLNGTVVDGHLYTRTSYVHRVEIKARDNTNGGSTLQLLRAYDLVYDDDSSGGFINEFSLPRLTRVVEHGIGGAPSRTIAEYGYGSAVSGSEFLYNERTRITLPAGMSTTKLASSAEGTFNRCPGGLPGVNCVAKGKETWATQLIVDITGDGLPDLIQGWKSPGGGHYTYFYYPNISENGEIRFSPERIALGKDLPLGLQTTVTSGPYAFVETWTALMDWNGDGRLDLVDARGKSSNHWVVYLNFRPADSDATNIEWKTRRISLDHIRGLLLSAEIPFSPLHSPGISWGFSNRVPLNRSFSAEDWLEEHLFRWECDLSKNEWGGKERIGRERLPTNGDRFVTNTYTEWTLKDINGDGYPDFVANSHGAMATPTTDWECFKPESDCFFDPEDLACGFSDGDLLIYECTCTTSSGITLSPENKILALLNHGGALVPENQEVFVSQPLTLAEHPDGVEIGIQMRTSDTSPEWSGQNGFQDYNSDGIADYAGLGLGLGGSFTRGPYGYGYSAYTNNYREKCPSGAASVREYKTQQTAGLVDVTGDGILDRVHKDPHTRPKGWYVSVGNGTGFGKEYKIQASGFEISHALGTCGGKTPGTVGGLYDLDGDGSADLVRLIGGKMVVFSVEGAVGEFGAPAAGRLVSIGNGYKATTKITYRSIKTDPQGYHRVPFREVVVTKKEVEVQHGTGESLAPTYFAYTDASLIYDPLAERWVFPGYRREVTLSGVPSDKPGQISGVATHVLKEWPSRPGDRFELRAMASLPRFIQRYEGWFPADPRLFFDSIPSGAAEMGRTELTYDIRELPYGPEPGPNDVCGDVDPYTNDLGVGDPNLCLHRAILYLQTRETWTGPIPTSGTGESLKTKTTVETVDHLGRPVWVHHYGDLRDAEDDVCEEIDYAKPVAGVDEHFTAVHSVHLNRCGGVPQGNYGPRLAGIRFEYDNLGESPSSGQVQYGAPTQKILERYDPETGEFLGEYVAASMAYENWAGKASRIERTRTLGGSATEATEYVYDPWALTVAKMTRSASDGSGSLPSLVEHRQLSVLPSVSSYVVGPNGEQRIIYSDGFGRPRLVSLASDGNEYVIEDFLYDDNPDGRTITRREFPGNTPLSGYEGTVGRRDSVTHLDALGRTRFVEHHLGSDYGRRSLISAYTRYDGLGRARFVADTFSAARASFDPDDERDTESLFGTTYDYDINKLTAVNHAHGELSGVRNTNLSSNVFASSYQYRYEDGKLIVRERGPEDLRSESPRFGQYSERIISATGRLLEQSVKNAGTVIELSRYEYSLLGKMTQHTRYGDPETTGQSVTTKLHFDSLGNLLSIREPSVAPKHFIYDEWGNQLSSSWNDGNGNENIDRSRYDGFGREVKRELVRRNLSTHSDAVEWTSSFFYDFHSGKLHQPESGFLGRLSHTAVQGKTGLERETLLSYNPFGRVQHQVRIDAEDGRPFSTQRRWSAGGELEELRFNLPGINDHVLYQRDSAGRIRIVSLNGRAIYSANSVDDYGRYLNVQLGNGTSHERVYQDAGRRLLAEESIRTPGGDLLHRDYRGGASSTYAAGYVKNDSIGTKAADVLKYGFAGLLFLIFIMFYLRYAAGFVWGGRSWARAKRDLLTSYSKRQKWLASTAVLTLAFFVNTLGCGYGYIHGAGSGRNEVSTDNTGYDAQGRLTKVHERIQRAAKDEMRVTKGYQYDGLGRLSKASTTRNLGNFNMLLAQKTYSYDGLGNITAITDGVKPIRNRTMTYSPAAWDRLLEVNRGGTTVQSYQYDQAGNVAGAANPNMSVKYDPASRATTVWQNDYASYRYDEADEVSRFYYYTVAGYFPILNRSERRYGALIKDVAQAGSAQGWIERSIPGPQGVIATLKGTGASAKTIYRHADALTARWFTDEHGDIVQEVDHDAYGQAVKNDATPWSQTETRELWNEGEKLGNTQVTRIGARLYQADIGRFLQQDPVLITSSSSRSNPYGFAFSDPINFKDPSGLFPVDAWIERALGGGSTGTALATAVAWGWTAGRVWSNHTSTPTMTPAPAPTGPTITYHDPNNIESSGYTVTYGDSDRVDFCPGPGQPCFSDSPIFVVGGKPNDNYKRLDALLAGADALVKAGTVYLGAVFVAHTGIVLLEAGLLPTVTKAGTGYGAGEYADDAIGVARRLLPAAEKGPVIIGETMTRVEAAAAMIPNAKILNDMPEYWNMGLKAHEVTSKMMQYNRRWWLHQLQSGRSVINLGIDPNRKMPSIFYQMERCMLKNYDKLYPGKVKVIKP